MNFPLICSNIPAPAYGIYISQLMRYSRAGGSYQDFLDRGLLLTRKLLNKGFLLIHLKLSLRKCYGRQNDLVDRYGISVSQMTTSGAGTDYPSGAHEFTPGLCGVRVNRSLTLNVCFVDRCLSLSFFF